jgi:hypothetical protein
MELRSLRTVQFLQADRLELINEPIPNANAVIFNNNFPFIILSLVKIKQFSDITTTSYTSVTFDIAGFAKNLISI